MGLEDVNRDGRKDLWLKFRGEDTSLRPGDVSATLEGLLDDGSAFSGTDRVRVTR